MHQYSTDAALREEMAEHFRAQFKTKTRDAWFQTLFDEDICVAPVYSLSEAFADSHNRERGMVVELEAPGVGPVKQVGVAPKFSETPGRVRHTAPYPGQDTDAILASLGVEAPVIADLRAREVVA